MSMAVCVSIRLELGIAGWTAPVHWSVEVALARASLAPPGCEPSAADGRAPIQSARWATQRATGQRSKPIRRQPVGLPAGVPARDEGASTEPPSARTVSTTRAADGRGRLGSQRLNQADAGDHLASRVGPDCPAACTSCHPDSCDRLAGTDIGGCLSKPEAKSL
jgi:hypothetical protein